MIDLPDTMDADLAAAIERARADHTSCLLTLRSRKPSELIAEAEAVADEIAPSSGPLAMTQEDRNRQRRRIRDEQLAERVARDRQANAWKRIDLIALRIICKQGEFRSLIRKAYSFALAHALGFVSEKTRLKRLRRCGDCTFRQEATLPVLGTIHYCMGANGGRGCGCSQHPLWPFSSLGYKTSLGNYACPIGKFPRRWFDGGLRFRWWVWLSCLLFLAFVCGLGRLAAWMIGLWVWMTAG